MTEGTAAIESLADWLRTKACISETRLPGTLEKLDKEEVETVQDLEVLRRVGGLKDVFTRVTEAKIIDALELPWSSTALDPMASILCRKY